MPSACLPRTGLTAWAFYEENLGTEATVLFEEDVNDGMMQGFTENYVRVEAKYDPLLINELKKVKLIDINTDSGHVLVEEAEQEVLVH